MRRFFLLGEFLLLTQIIFGAYLWQNPVDVRSQSLGDSLLGNNEHIPDLLDNPAIYRPTKSFYFTQALLDNDSRRQAFTYRHYIDNYCLGLGAIYFTVGEILSYDRSKNYLGKTSISEYLLTGNFGYRRILLGGDFWMNLGVNLEYFSSTLDRFSAETFLLNPGLIIVNEAGYPLIALAINYPLTAIKYYQTSEQLPVTVKASAGFLSPDWASNLNVEWGVIFHQPDKYKCFVGAEYRIFSVIFARLGLNLSSPQTLNQFFSYGLGFSPTKNFSLDYSFRQQEELASQHFLGLMIRLGKYSEPNQPAKVNHLQRGKELFQNGRYAESILELNQALDEDPNNPEILDLMRRAGAQIKGK